MSGDPATRPVIGQPSRPADSAARSRALLTVATIAVGFAAADTYVVVLALPDMMTTAHLGPDQLQRATPIVSGFLLGYVAMLPLIGRIADLRGRVPVLVGSLVLFAIGSLVTAGSYDLASMVVGRFLQGVGGGGLVPATLALVADRWTAERRGLPLGIVGGVQELGAVVGPLYGGLVLAHFSWHAIFWLNLAAAAALALTLTLLSPAETARMRRFRGRVGAELTSRRPDLIGAVLGVLALVALGLTMVQPGRLASGLTTGLAFVPYVGDSRWSTPVAVACYLLALLFVLRQLTARRPLVGARGVADVARAADLPGAGLLAFALAAVVLAFATSDPERAVFSPAGPWLLVLAAGATAGFGWRQRWAASPLMPLRALRPPAAWGAVAASFFVGAALIAALVDVPIFARLTVAPDSQLQAALVLLRMLVAVPVGAVLGGLALRRSRPAPLAAVGMALVVAGLAWMGTWTSTSLEHWTSTVPLVVGGLGFGLALAPINAALLAATPNAVHGLASALLVVARTIGMLVGISVLTTIGLRRYADVVASGPTVRQLCPSNQFCTAYEDHLKLAGIAQLQTVFVSAAVSAAIAGLLSLLLLRTVRRYVAVPPASAAIPSSSSRRPKSKTSR